MLRFERVRVESYDLDNFVVAWIPELNPATLDPAQIQYFVQRSNAEGGPFLELNTAAPLVDTYQFVDTQVNRLNKWRRFFYRIRAVDGTVSPSVEVVSDTAVINMRNLSVQELELIEIRRTEKILLSGIGVTPGFTGNRCLLFHARSFGQRCTGCWDPIKLQVRRSRCMECFGTGFRGGYHDPVLTYVAFSPSTETRQLSPLGEGQPNKVKAWMGNYPLSSRGDLLILRDNSRWKVEVKAQTHILRETSRQLLDLQHIQPGDIEYSMEFDQGALDAT